ncbi:MAG TPA: ABC transporter ATP-binding protein [Burkholderiales bacterium]|nr:ABC transporter ATP-binding protein [Burkholderiales bacterium]
MINNMPLLRIENLKTWLDNDGAPARAVDGLSLTLERGETFALLGESGCGKSMTALSIMRLLPDVGRIVSGEVLLEGQNLLALPEVAMRTVRGRRVAMIFQEPSLSLNPVLTVGEQIAEVLERHKGMSGAQAKKRILELLDAVGIPDSSRRYREYPFQLSGGMKQRVMIAIALAGEPDLLIADEPTTALDVTIQAQVLDLIRDLQKRTGMAILLITHDLGVVSEMAHKVAVMYAGQIVETAQAREFFANPAHPYSRKLFASLPHSNKRTGKLEIIKGTVPPLTRDFQGCRFAERCDFAWDKCRKIDPGWSEAACDHTVRCHLYSEGKAAKVEGSAPAAGYKITQTNEPVADLLDVSGLKVYFPVHKGLFKRVVGYVKAVDGVTLEIKKGRTLALVGESGCGKTTVGKGILQLVPVTSGSVRYNGIDLTRLSRSDLRSRRSEFQIIFQDPYSSLNPRMRVSEIIEEGMTALGIAASAEERAKRGDVLLEQVGLSPEMKSRYPHEFSGGQRQRIAIARALAVNPKLIICDEPTSALDVSVQAQILNLLKELQDRLGLAYLFITHNISVVEYLAHEVAVMYLGRIVETGTVEEVLNNPKHPYTRALLSAVPVIDKSGKREIIRLKGDLPSPLNPPSGCHFHPRCPDVMPVCKESYPGDSRFSSTHCARCHLYPTGN